MRAAVLNAIGDVRLELSDDVTTVGPGPDEIRIRVRASGICHSDLSAMDGPRPALAPGLVGHEGAGEVLEAGAAVSHLVPGDHVTVSFASPCGECPNCLRGQPNLCPMHTVAAVTTPRFRHSDTPLFGYAGLGTFADEVVVPASGAIKVAPDVPFDTAALIACGVLTGVGAVLTTAEVDPGSTVVILGCGGVGVPVIEGARIAGATTIVAVDPVEGKHDIAKRFGATHAVTPEGFEELKAQLTGGEGFDYAFDVVGESATIRSGWDAVRRGGALVIVGAGRDEATVSFSAQARFLHGKKVLGSAHAHRDTARRLRFWRAGRLDLAGMISRCVGFADINGGLGLLRKGSTDFIRQVVTFN